LSPDFEDVFEAGVNAEGGIFEGFGKEFRDFFDGDGTGEFAGFGAAHAVADGESKVLSRKRSFADFAQVMNFVRVEADGEEGVFVIFADFAAVGASPPSERAGAACFC
jgi:hypothetical protein